MAALQRRHERMQNLEHSFAEERRMREQQASSAEMELMQQRILVEQRKVGEPLQMDAVD